LHVLLTSLSCCVDAKEVLIPLLDAMGFDAFHNHGANELGKDFICWKNSELGKRKI